MSIKIIRENGEETVGSTVNVIKKYQEQTINKPAAEGRVQMYQPKNGLYVDVKNDTSELEEALDAFRQDDSVSVLVVPYKEPPKFNETLGMYADDLVDRVKVYSKGQMTTEEIVDAMYSKQKNSQFEQDELQCREKVKKMAREFIRDNFKKD
tara:strand:+ start:321 stop:776 length:456 start_codon:yes stop_codon:yes gene_type:complete